MSYEKGIFAFFDGTSSAYRKACKTGDVIAGYKIAEISSAGARLEANGKQIELSVGMQLKKQDEGEWQPAGRAESFSSSNQPAASPEKTENASNAEVSDVMKKLMQNREQELK